MSMHPHNHSHKSENENETKMLALKLANNYFNFFALQHKEPLMTDCTLHLEGQLGAGKTTFTRAFLEALGLKERIKSPTYTLIEPYKINIQNRELNIYHFDLYRIQNQLEWFDAGFDEYFTHCALRIIEWPDRFKSFLPQPDCLLSISMLENSRVFNIQAFSKIGRWCLAGL